MTDSHLAAVWDELLNVLPTGWWVGQPSYHPERGEWLLYCYDPTEHGLGRDGPH